MKQHDMEIGRKDLLEKTEEQGNLDFKLYETGLTKKSFASCNCFS